MKCSYLTVIGIVFILQAHYSHEECRVLQSPMGLQNYWCNTIQELELDGNPQLLNANIHNGNTVPVFSNSTYERTPNLQVILIDDTANGISPDSYKILKGLSENILNNNELKTISRGVFENLPLQKVLLSSNGIQSIQVGAFSNMQKLSELCITHNNLRSVEIGIFNSLSVETLDLSNNKISVIRRNALHNMKNLKNLHLNGNALTEFHPDTFLNVGSTLETLHLQHNGFTEFNRDAVRTLNNLRVLNLGSNLISKLVIYTFEDLLKLEQLILSNNRLEELDENVFGVDGAPNLVKLLLNNNKLSYLTPKLLGRLTSIKSIRLGGNPWECRCFDDIMKWLIDNNVKQICDSDYYTGTKPICVVLDVQSSSCDYSAKTTHLFQKFQDTISATVVRSVCSI